MISGMRRILIVVLVVLILVAGGLFFFVAGNLDRYHGQIQAQIEKKLNRPVTLGHLGLRLFPLSVSVAGFSIADDPSFKSSRPFAAADNVFISVGFFSLLRGAVTVNDLTLGQPTIELIRSAAGTWNYSSLGKSNQPQASSSSEFSLGRLKVIDGRVGYTDLMPTCPDKANSSSASKAKSARSLQELRLPLPSAVISPLTSSLSPP